MNQVMLKKTIWLAVLSSGVLCAGLASATHKNWLLKDGGAECAFWSPGTRDYSNGILKNLDGYDKSAVCPIALSGRWTPTVNGTVFDTPRWANALGAVVYVSKATSSSSVSCYSVGKFTDDAVYYGMSVTNSGAAGVQGLELAVQRPWAGGGSTWGDGTDLEAHEQQTLRSLSFVCVLPGDGSGVIGHRAKICQLTADCWEDGMGAGEGSVSTPPPTNPVPSSTSWNFVQTSGVECVPEGPTGVSGWQRTASGMLNNNAGASRVFCPLTPPADDSAESNRATTQPVVYFSGGSSSYNCVTNGTCPQCKLRWWRRNSVTAQESSVFTAVSSGGTLGSYILGGGTNLGKEIAVGISCNVPRGVTISGVQAGMSTSGISGGV